MVRREFLESMVDVAAEGRTVLLSSHQIHEVERVADMVAILRHGKLVLCERLDELKQNVRELTVTLRNGSPDIPDVPGNVIRREQLDRQWRMLVRGLNESQMESFRTGQNIQHVELRPTNLEEIFVGYMRSENE
jgi:ABC-2 type transport system ATP-binding protein